MTISPPSPALWIIISWLAFKFLMASFSSTVKFWWWLIHFLLHKLIIPFFIDILINILINFITVVLRWVLWVIFMLFGHILSFLFFFFSKHRYDAKNKPDNNELEAHIHKHQHKFVKDIEVLTFKGNLHQKNERELREDKFICFLGTKNIELNLI